MASNFALIGAAGYIAPRHMKAIRDTGNRLLAAVDPHDSVGILDSISPDTRFFTEIERFDRFLEKRRRDETERAHYISICSPNYLHDAHVRLALRLHAHAICEKPLVINPWNLDALELLEQEYGRRVYTVLQLRIHPTLKALKAQLDATPSRERLDVQLTYITGRGPWYHVSWKGSEEKSGGLVMNIGIHFFDLLLWLFGDVERSVVHVRRPDRVAGALMLQRARVRWLLSCNLDDLPETTRKAGKRAFRSMTIGGQELEFSDVFEDLHRMVYTDILEGGGFGVADARPSIELVYRIRRTEPEGPSSSAHPMIR